MKRIMTAALLLVLGAAQAMPVTAPRMSSQSAGATAQKDLAHVKGDADGDDDEAAPPVHIHRARPAAGKKPALRKNALRRSGDNDARKPGAATPPPRRFTTPAAPADASIAQSAIKK